MASKAQFFGLNYFGPNVSGSIGDDGGKFTLGDRLFLDRMLQALSVHDHAGDDVRVPDPIGTPALNLDTVSGQLPGGLNVYYRVSYLDEFGLESAASPEAVVPMPATLAVPDFPILTAQAIDDADTNPGLGVGVYSYGLTATAGAQETPLGLAAQIGLDGSLSCVLVTFPALQDGQDGWHVWRRALNDPGWTQIGEAIDTDDDFLDDYAVAADPDAGDPANSPPTVNLTSATNAVTVSVPDPDLLSAADTPVKRWRLYRSFSSGAYAAASLVVELNTSINADGSGGLEITYLDDGSVPLQQGQPLDVSQTAMPATKLRYLLIDTSADLPDATLFPPGFPAITVDSYALYIVGSDHTWHVLGGGGTITINYRGVYDPAVAYNLGDVVTGSDSEGYLLHVAGPVTGDDPTTDVGVHWTAQPMVVTAASGISYNPATSGMTATTVQAAVDELKTDIDAVGSAAAISYDHTVSGLAATDVQAALDELKADDVGGGGGDAADVTYDHTTSGLAATTVQEALDELTVDIASGGGGGFVPVALGTGPDTPIIAFDTGVYDILTDGTLLQLLWAPGSEIINEHDVWFDAVAGGLTPQVPGLWKFGVFVEVIGLVPGDAVVLSDIDGTTAQCTVPPGQTAARFQGLYVTTVDAASVLAGSTVIRFWSVQVYSAQVGVQIDEVILDATLMTAVGGAGHAVTTDSRPAGPTTATAAASATAGEIDVTWADAASNDPATDSWSVYATAVADRYLNSPQALTNVPAAVATDTVVTITGLTTGKDYYVFAVFANAVASPNVYLGTVTAP